MKRIIESFFLPPVEVVQAKALANARREMEMHQQATEYHSAMVEMFQKRIARLEHVERAE